MSQLPTGTITLLFTDIEGSTLLLQQLGERYAEMLATCRQLLRTAFQQWNGVEVDTQGDAFFVVFARASDAISAVIDMQRALASHDWPNGAAVALRMGLHTGEPTRTAEGYIGLDVHHAARIMSVGHGGQVLLSQTTHELVKYTLPEGVSLRDLGEHRLKDLLRPGHLYQLIIADLPADFPPLKTLDNSPNNLPVQPTSLIGREKEVAALLNLLQREEVRLLTLTGPGGTGKTRLGLQAAAELYDTFSDGVYFVNLAPISDPDLVVPALAQTLDVKEIAGQPLLDLLKTSLHWKCLLLLLDNFEQVASAAVQVADLLAACPHLKVMVTSRATLHVRGEQEFPVPPLAVPDPQHLPDLMALSQYEAVELFVSRAQATKPTFHLTATDAYAIAEICARLDGLPLAIELAAARAKVISPQVLLARLERRLQVLTQGSVDLPERQQTLRNTLSWSYDLLSPQEQRLFRQISVFVGGFTLEAVEAVSITVGVKDADLLEGIASLLDKSLLQRTERDGEESRFVMLETVREYGLEALEASGELEVTRQAHADYYLALAEDAEPELSGPQQITWFERLEREHGNLRAAMQWSLEQAGGDETGYRKEIALRLCAALGWYWFVHDHLSEGRKWMEWALTGSEGVVAPVRGKVLSAAGLLAFEQGDYDRAEALCGESLITLRELGDKVGLANSLHIMGLIARARGNYTTALTLIEESLAFSKMVDDVRSMAYALDDLASVALQQGEYARAWSLAEEALALFRKLGDKRGIAYSLKNLGRVIFNQGDPTRAYTLLQEGLALFREVGDKQGIAVLLNLLGQVAILLGDNTTARLLLEEGLALSKEMRDSLDIAKGLFGLGRLAFCQSDDTVARTLYMESLAIFRALDDKEGAASCLEGLASVVMAQGESTWAAQLWGAAETLREAIDAPISPVYRADYERSVAAARAHLSEKPFVAAWAEGRIMTPEQALAAEGQPLLPMQTPPAKPAATYPDGLTAREVEVLRLLAQGLTDAQIAEQLVLSLHTVHAHLRAIYSKLGVTSRSAATRYAFEHQLV